MSLYADIQAAQATVDADKAKLAKDQAALDALLAKQVRGGPDVSEHNGDVDWAKVATVYDWCAVRVCDGDYQDKFYSPARISAIRSAGLAFSPYAYARVASPTNGQRTGRTEAAMDYYFAAKAGWGKSGDLPMVYDAEQDPGETDTFQGQPIAKAANHVVDWVVAYKGLTQHWPIIYTNPSTAKLLAANLDAGRKATLGLCPLWLAHWDVATPTVPAPWTDWMFWQYTSSGTCPGIAGSVDLSHFSGAKSDLDALRIP